VRKANGPKTRAREKRRKSKIQGPQAEASHARRGRAKGYDDDGVHQRKVAKVLTLEDRPHTVARWLDWWNGLEVGEKDEGPVFGPF
jgi:hypothetical protein